MEGPALPQLALLAVASASLNRFSSRRENTVSFHPMACPHVMCLLSFDIFYSTLLFICQLLPTPIYFVIIISSVFFIMKYFKQIYGYLNIFQIRQDYNFQNLNLGL